MVGKTIKKITYRDYRAYPVELLNAARFRDSYITLPTMRFINLADKTKMLSQLVALSQWESDHTDV